MKILVVDDDLNFCVFMERTLGALRNCDIVFAHDGIEARAELLARQFDFVCLDLKMPKCSGQEVLAFIRAEQPRLPVLILSGVEQAAPEMLADAYTVFAEKPMQMSELSNVVREHVTTFFPEARP